MDPEQVARMIAALAEEEESLVDGMKKADVRLSQVRSARAALVALESEEPIQFDGNMADACRTILKKNAGRSLSPLEVRDELKAIGYDFSQHKHGNIMAVIHSVLKRLAESGEVKTKEAKDGSTRYYWPLPTVSISKAAPPIKPVGGTSFLSALEQAGNLEQMNTTSKKLAELSKQFELSPTKAEEFQQHLKSLDDLIGKFGASSLLKLK
jgi:hypothetical protein